jgi:MSHA biogenesis protein MshP
MTDRAPRRRCQGFALMMAVFIIVTLAAVGVYLVTISTGQVAAASQDEQAARAYQAARTGVDWGAYQVLVNTGGGFATTCAGGGAPNTQSIPLQQGLSGFRAEVTCQRVGSETEAGVTVTSYRLTVTGCNHSPSACGTSVDPTYVERQLQLTLAK